jgi:hypothetical protein
MAVLNILTKDNNIDNLISDTYYNQEQNIHYISYDHFALFAYFAVINNCSGKTLFSNILPPQRAQRPQRVSLICLVLDYYQWSIYCLNKSKLI